MNVNILNDSGLSQYRHTTTMYDVVSASISFPIYYNANNVE